MKDDTTDLATILRATPDAPIWWGGWGGITCGWQSDCFVEEMRKDFAAHPGSHTDFDEFVDWMVGEGVWPRDLELAWDHVDEWGMSCSICGRTVRDILSEAFATPEVPRRPEVKVEPKRTFRVRVRIETYWAVEPDEFVNSEYDQEVTLADELDDAFIVYGLDINVVAISEASARTTALNAIYGAESILECEEVRPDEGAPA